MVPLPAAMMIDAPLALFLVWAAFSLALVVIGAVWVFRPAVALVPLKRLGVVWLVLTLAVAVVSWQVFGGNRGSASAESELAKAPDFSFRTVDGRWYSRDSLRGKVVLVEFWASWCEPCREALPEMFRIYNEFKTPRFVMIGVSENASQAKFENFVAEKGILWPQDWDPKGQLADEFSDAAIPAYAVIDPDGRLRFTQRGYNSDTYSHLRQAIMAALGTATAGSRIVDARN